MQILTSNVVNKTRVVLGRALGVEGGLPADARFVFSEKKNLFFNPKPLFRGREGIR